MQQTLDCTMPAISPIMHGNPLFLYKEIASHISGLVRISVATFFFFFDVLLECFLRCS